MKDIIIVGSGPVGSFIATLCRQLGLSVTVYEKRQEFSRNINLKIEDNFFKEVSEVLSRLNVETDFFAKLNDHLHNQKNRILIKDLEEKFTEEAKRLGAKYIIREIESFEELHEEHKNLDPIILDCTGRNSKLRINEFGPDQDNIVTTPLQYAMYVNFKAKVTDNISSLYQVMKYIKNIKLTEVVVSKSKDNNGFSDITLPVFITDELAEVFNREYPNINREPLNPFNSQDPVPDNIFLPISSLLGNLIMDGCSVDLNSVKVKKIEISCGYAKKRSKDNHVCLGDSAIHLAFFRSLNLGLKHALQLFIKLSMLQANVQAPKDDEIIKQFKEHYPHLHPIKVYPTVARNVFLVVTKVTRYGCFSYCLTNHERKRLTSRLGVRESQISNILKELSENLSTWNNILADFETKRDEDIKKEIHSNKTKSVLYDHLSWFIDINGKSFIKISELARAVRGKYSLYREDFEFLLKCFKARRDIIAISDDNVISVRDQLKSDQSERVYEKEDLSDEEKTRLINDAICNRSNKKDGFISALIRNELIQMQKPNTTQILFNLLCKWREVYAEYPKKWHSKEYIALCSVVLLGTVLTTALFVTGRIKPKMQYIIAAIGVVIVVAAAAFVVTRKLLKANNRVERGIIHQVNVDHSYIDELQERFSNIDFKRLKKINSMYITNPNNKSTSNDARIFKETQIKRILRSSLSPFVPQTVKSKLSYFSQQEDKDVSKIYKFDDFQSLQSEERYAIQNIGHATLLIQVPDFNILIDPVFYDLNSLLYPAKTAPHKSVQELPKIDVIVISHNHRDHVDQRSLQELLKRHQEKNWPQPKVFVPMGDRRLLESFGFNQVREVEWYTKISVTNEAKKTVNFISIPADHRSGRSGIDHHKSLVTGWVINPQQGDVIFKYSGDTRPLTDEAQQAIDAVLWNEIKYKNQSMKIPDIICFEPSGPNYTRCDMDITHQSTSYSALLKFIEAKNFAWFSERSIEEFLKKIQTIMVHHNKYELGPDRFNEGLFVLKKLIKYLDLNEENLNKELIRQEDKLKQDLDKKKLKENTCFTSKPIIAILPNQTSLLVHAKDFIIREIIKITGKLQGANETDKKEYLTEYLKKNTIFPKIGERLDNEQIVNSIFDVESVQKYNGKNLNL